MIPVWMLQAGWMDSKEGKKTGWIIRLRGQRLQGYTLCGGGEQPHRALSLAVNDPEEVTPCFFYQICSYVKAGGTSHALNSRAGIQRDLWGCLYRNGMKLSKGKCKVQHPGRKKPEHQPQLRPAWGEALRKRSLSKPSVSPWCALTEEQQHPMLHEQEQSRSITVVASLLGACFTAAPRIVHPVLATQYKKDYITK